MGTVSVFITNVHIVIPVIMHICVLIKHINLYTHKEMNAFFQQGHIKLI